MLSGAIKEVTMWCYLCLGAVGRGAYGDALGEGDGGVGASRPRALRRADSRPTAPRQLYRQAPPCQHLPEDRGGLQERGGKDGFDGAVDRALGDHPGSPLLKRWLQPGWHLRGLNSWRYGRRREHEQA